MHSKIPGDWFWQFSCELDGSSDPDIRCIKRQSLCELEGDATIDGLSVFKCYACFFSFLSLFPFLVMSFLFFVKEFTVCGSAEIINKKFITYTSLSQTRSDVKMVQSLIPIWEVCTWLIC